MAEKTITRKGVVVTRNQSKGKGRKNPLRYDDDKAQQVLAMQEGQADSVTPWSEDTMSKWISNFQEHGIASELDEDEKSKTFGQMIDVPTPLFIHFPGFEHLTVDIHTGKVVPPAK